MLLSEEVIPTGNFRAVTDIYRTEDGEAYFEFRFEYVDTHYEIDILRSPEYGSRDTSAHPTHRLSSSRGGKMICFGDPSILQTLDNCRYWAAMWAEATWKYIQHGTPFPS